MAQEAPEGPIERAVERRGSMDAYMHLLVGLAGTVTLDERTRNIVFGQVLGHLSAEVARKASRPWIYLSLVLLAAFFALVLYLNNIMLQLALGLI